ncbi:ARM repeat-containing protein [Lentinula edodes]|uniref:MMS19 nucleotide excision repair protein n=1 Tax=Lentinula lateritia TaxID=40482 RepID=A0A9W9AWW9_9AGAR|nr:ARM repeat-containing protein [Lentinula edodes]
MPWFEVTLGNEAMFISFGSADDFAARRFCFPSTMASASDSTERLVRTWMASEREEEIVKAVSEISNGSTSLLNVVKALGEYLTSEEDALRTKGVEFLSAVLGRCPPEKLNRQAARVLTSFYCSKLEDSETVVPALKGLVSLTKMPSSTSEDVPSILDAIFTHVKMKGLVQSVRFFVFTIIDTLMARHRQVIKDMNDSFLGRYIALVDGEKDPRNLLVAFAIDRVLLIEFDINNFIESLFNITFCYFPITFRPPPNDPYGITTDDLRQALRKCLNSTPAFGPLAIPVFLEKLAAGSPTTKRDTLESMSVCFPVYGSALARSHARKLWNSLKLEIFQPTDSITEEFALKTTQDLVKTIYTSQTADGTDSDIEGLARDACEECIAILREPEKSQAKPAIKILCAFMSTTPSVSRYTVAQTAPYLVKLYAHPDNVAARPSILLLLSDLIAAARDSMAANKVDDSDSLETPLSPYKDEILSIVSSALKVSSSRDPALACLLGLVSTEKLVSDEELGFIVHSVDEILLEESDEAEETNAPALQLLVTISQKAVHHIKEQTLPLLFSMLPEDAPARDAALDRARAWRILSALNTVCRPLELFETLVIRLTTRLDLLCVPSETVPLPADREPRVAYAHSILITLHQTLLAKVDDGHADVAKYIETLVPRLFNLFIYSALVSNEVNLIATDTRLITVAGQIIGTVVQNTAAQRQDTFIRALFAAYIDGDINRIAEGYHKLPTTSSFSPLHDSSPLQQRNLVILMASAVVPLHKEIQLPVSDLSVFLGNILTWSLAEVEAIVDLQRESTWKMISAILNKRHADASFFIENMLHEFWPRHIADRSTSAESRNRAIRPWVWISKALLVCNHAQASQFADVIFLLFDDEDIKWNAAKSFGDIVRTDTILTKQNHASIKMLYAQRFVGRTLPRIIDGAKNPSEPGKQLSYLVALTSLISSIPKALYFHEMATLIPLLVRGLDLPDHDIRCQVIDTFLAVAEGDSPDIVSDHAPSLITTMLKNSSVENMPSVKVRVSALRYLGVLPSIVRYDVLHPLKATVIKQLAVSLDDPKRAVRKEAVDARTKWFKSSG